MALRVVIFEDEQVTRDVLSRLVSSCGHEVHCFPDPTCCPLYHESSCVCSAEQACGDVLITDNRMPVMSGLQFIQQQHERGCRGVLRNKAVISGYLSPEELELSEKLGCTFFPKPLDWEKIRAWLDEREAVLNSP